MLLTFKEAVQQIKDDTERLLPLVLDPGKSEGGKMRYLCPDCQHGAHGGGISFAKEYGDTTDNATMYCYRCGWKGSIIDAYMLKYGQTYQTAVCELADLDSITIIDENDRTERPQTASKGTRAETIQKSTEEPAEANKSAEGNKENCADYINGLLPAWQSDTAREYLTGRGFTQETAERFNLRYDPARAFYDKEAKKWINLPAIIFPYNSNSTYYSARSTEGKYFYKPSEKKAGKEPLFNPAALFAEGPCFICEAQIDAISIAQSGGQAVAIGGTGGYRKVVEKCESEDKRPAAPLILLFDNDDTGREEQPKLEADLKANRIPYIIAQIDFDSYSGPHKDANDLLQADPERLAADIQANIKEASKSEIERFLDETYTQKYKGVPTGIKGLDKLLGGGLIPQTFILIGGEAGTGKTTLATQIFENMAEAGHECRYYNLEMSKAQMLARGLARYSNEKYKPSLTLTTLDILQGYRLSEETRRKERAAGVEYQERILNNLQYNPDNVTNELKSILEDMESTAQDAIAHGRPVPYFCIDYLHIMQGNPGEDTAEMLKRAVVMLKDFITKYDTIIIGIMAHNRSTNKKHEADIAAGRDTSALEYSADLQLALTRKDSTNWNKVTLDITKSRFTPVTNDKDEKHKGIELEMNGEISYFKEADKNAGKDKRAAQARSAAGDPDDKDDWEDISFDWDDDTDFSRTI